MGSAIVLGVMLLFLVVFLLGLLSSLDWEAVRSTRGGSLSPRGVRAVVGGGFVVGLAYGLFVGIQSGAETWYWLFRGLLDGLVVACAGAFYLGYQQRRRRAVEASSAAALAAATPSAEPEDQGTGSGDPDVASAGEAAPDAVEEGAGRGEADSDGAGE